MAGDWIPMRIDLWDCPELVRILSAMCPQDVRNVSARVRKKSELVGALFRLWSLFDQYTEDGILHGYTAETVNEMVGIDHFAENLEVVGWLQIHADSLEMPRFERHLGASAKRRMKDAQRKRESRKNVSAKCPQNVRKMSAQKRTTEQKRTEEKSNTHTHADVKPLEGFEQTWQRWCDWMTATQGAFNQIQAEAVLMDLHRRGPEKAARDVDFSIQKGAKSILDSDDDWSKRRTAGKPEPKEKLRL